MRTALSLLSALVLFGCAQTRMTPPAAPPTPAPPPPAPRSSMQPATHHEPSMGSGYHHAVHNASLATEGKIAYDLIAITADNKDLVWRDSTLLVVTWKGKESYERNIKPHDSTSTKEAYVVWVTTAPEVQQFCRNYWHHQPNATLADVELRLKQLLGLNPEWSYDLFIELWVNPADLFRPCVDPEVDDRHCELKFGKEKPSVVGIRDYEAFYKNLYFTDFRYAPGVPWTGLGYTYDWGSHLTIQGASEFILRPGAPYAIRGAIPTTDYCRPESD